MHTAKLTLFVVSKDEWDTKEGTDKSIKSNSRASSQAEATSSSEKIKPISFAIVELYWPEGIRQAGS